ncbi:MAG TPA: diacylglycerol kinase family protein [Pilimelia sp.]|nr:diacylglycerol kinase family protein [Pilimelia sp.]
MTTTSETSPPPAPAGTRVTRVAVVAHRRKTLGGGLDELRRQITAGGVEELLWYEVPKSRKAPKRARRAVKEGAELVFVWGGDGMVQRCVDALAGSNTPVAIVPAGTANLFAANLGIPADLAEAVRIGLHGARRRLDLGRLNGEHFAVMAGAGFDGEMIAEADRDLKDRIGRLAYVWTGLRHVDDRPVRAKIRVDGTPWFDGDASCVLLGNVGRIQGGIRAFDDARPDDGWLDVGVTTAEGAGQWARALGRLALGRSDRSPFVRMTRAKKIRVDLDAPMMYELDGGAREPARKLKARVVPGAITVCVPEPGASEPGEDAR